jgi:hypothetical protein
MKNKNFFISLLFILFCFLGCSTAAPNPLLDNDGGHTFLLNLPTRFTECRENNLGQYACIGTVTEDTVEVLANTQTWSSWPPTLFVAIVRAVGCEDSVERFFITAENANFSRIRFTGFGNGASLVDGFYTYVSVGPHCDLRNRTLTVEIFSQRDIFPRQVFYLQRRHISP